MLKKINDYIGKFGILVAFAVFLSRLYSYNTCQNKISYQILQIKHRVIVKYLLKNLCIDTKPSCERFINKNIPINSCIWTMWWQDTAMPENIKNSINNMKKNAGKREIIVVTKDNWNNYIDLPHYIVDKLKRGIITVTHFSDILRMNLLSRYGGLWLDAGIFPIKYLSNDIFDHEYFTRRVEPFHEGNISNSRWCGGITGGHVGFLFFDYMVNAFNEYWKKENGLIDYFLIDYLTAIAYENILDFRNAVELVDYNNLNLFDAEPKMNSALSEEFYNKLKLNNTFIRLHWRDSYNMYTEDGLLTLYGGIFSDEILWQRKA